MHIEVVQVNLFVEYSPFTIDLPADVEEITGIFVNADARLYARGAGTIGAPNTVSNTNQQVQKFLPPYPSQFRLKNQASGYFLTKELAITAGGKYRLGVQIKPMLIGKCIFKTNYGGAGIFHVQDIYPSQAVFPFALAGPELLSEVISYGKPGVPFSTVSIGGKAGEISGFLEWDKDQNWIVMDDQWYKNNKPTLLATSNDANDTTKHLSKEGITLTIYIRYR